MVQVEVVFDMCPSVIDNPLDAFQAKNVHVLLVIKGVHKLKADWAVVEYQRDVIEAQVCDLSGP